MKQSLAHVCLGALLFVGAAGCQGDGEVSNGTRPSLTARPDPGPPATYFGPKCTAEVSGATLPMCRSAVVQPVDGLTHLYLNFCMVNGSDLCGGPSPVYVSLLLPMASWSVGRVDHALGGRVEVKLPDGRRWLRDGAAGDPLPLVLTVEEQPNGADQAPTLFGELELSVPSADGQGSPIVLRARMN